MERALPTWRELHPADDPRIEAIRFARFREMPAWRKIEMMEALNEMAHELALIGLSERYPEADEEELRRRLADLLLGPELAAKVYGPLQKGIGDHG